MSGIQEYLSRSAEDAEKLCPPIHSVTAVNTTPVIAGGPDGISVHRVSGQLEWWGIRPTAVRGVWRWWIRVLLAGLLWGEGVTCDYRGLAELERLAGMGSTEEATGVFLEVKSNVSARPVEKLDESFFGDRRRAVQVLERRCKGREPSGLECLYLIPRYRLLAMSPEAGVRILVDRQPMPPHSVKLNITIRLRRERFRRYAPLYREALGLALALGGIGQMTSRGFGKFSFSGLSLGGGLVGEVYGRLRRALEEDGVLGELVEAARKTGRRTRGACIEAGDAGLPLVPAFHPEATRLELVKRTKYLLEPRPRGPLRYGGECNTALDVLVSSGRAFLKAEWKLARGDSLFASGARYHTWTAGLPRVIKRRHATGYLLGNGEPGRWQSPIRVTPIPGRPWSVAVYGFRTRDLYRLVVDEELTYHYLRRRRIPRHRPVLDILRGEGKSVEEAFDEAFDMVVDILSGVTSGGGGWL